MADNSPTSGGSGDVVATDDLTNVNGVAFTGAKVQRTKVGYGADGYLQDVTEAKGLPVTVNPTQNPAGLPVFDDAVNALLASTSTSNDARSLLDVLDPLSDNYVAPQAEIIGSAGRVFAQDPASGGLVMLPTTRNYTGAASGVNAIVISAPCADMSYVFVAFYGVSGQAVQIEALMPGGWQLLWLTSYGSGLTPGQNSTINSSGTLLGFGVSPLFGATQVRLKNTQAVLCNATMQLSTLPTPWMPGTQNVNNATAANLLMQAFGPAAEDAAASGNPVMVAGVARTAIVPTTVVAGDVVRHTLNISGSLITEPHCVDELRWSYAAAAAGIANSTVAVPIKTAPGAGTHLCLCSGFIMSEALTAATEFVIREITTTNVVFRTKLWTSGMAGTQITFDPPIKITSANGLEIVTLTASVAGAVYFNANGYTANG